MQEDGLSGAQGQQATAAQARLQEGAPLLLGDFPGPRGARLRSQEVDRRRGVAGVLLGCQVFDEFPEVPECVLRRGEGRIPAFLEGGAGLGVQADVLLALVQQVGEVPVDLAAAFRERLAGAIGVQLAQHGGH